MENELKTLLDNLISGVQIIDSNFNYSYINDAFLNQFKLEKDQVIHNSISKVFLQLKNSTLFEAFNECLTNNISKNFEHEFVFNNDQKQWFEFNIISIPTGLMIISNDIKNRKKVEYELKIAKEKAEHNEQSISSIYNTVGNIIFKLKIEKGAKYRFVSVNSEFLKVTGLTKDQIIGQLANDVIPEPSLSMVLNHYKTAIENKEIVRWEEVSNYPTGQLTGSVSIAPIYNSEGKCEFLVGAVHDITERKRDEVLLKEKSIELERLNKELLNINKKLTIAKEAAEISENKIKAFTEQSPLAIFTSNIKGNFTYVNQKWLHTSGMLIDEVINDGWLNVVHPEDREKVKKQWDTFIQNENKTWSLEYRITDNNGNIKWVESVAKELFDENKKIGYTGTNFDITERKLAEKAVMENQRINIIGEMTAAIAHDFNNSLQSMLGIVEIMLFQPNLTEKVKNQLNKLKKIVLNTGQRAKLVQRFGGDQAQKKQYSLFNLNHLIENLISNSQHIFNGESESKTINLKTDLNNIPNIQGVEGEISAVLLNILKNSYEAIVKEGIITIKTTLNKNNVVIQIQDNGIGMNEETRTRIFQPFYSTKGFDIGRGLGLSGAYSIIKEHGGQILVKETKINSGSTIEVNLPIKQS